jgi:hypothetical protein
MFSNPLSIVSLITLEMLFQLITMITVLQATVSSCVSHLLFLGWNDQNRCCCIQTLSGNPDVVLEVRTVPSINVYSLRSDFVVIGSILLDPVFPK